MGLASIFVCPEFSFWDALGCRNIIPDRMQSGVTKLLKMGMCNLNTCVAKNPKFNRANFQGWKWGWHQFLCVLSVVQCSFWDALGCRRIILDCMWSGVPKLPKMGMCNLNTCVAKHPKVPQISFASKSFEKVFNCKCTNFCCIFPLVIYPSKCL